MKSPKPPVGHQLPFEHLLPIRFEELCFALLTESGYQNLRHLGNAGKDVGADLVGVGPDGKRWVIQTKRVRSLPPSRASHELKKLLGALPNPPPEGYLLIVSATVSRAAEERLQELAEALEFDLEVRVIGRSELDAEVRRHPQLIERFFRISPSREIFSAGRDITIPGLLPAGRRYLRPVQLILGIALGVAIGAFAVLYENDLQSVAFFRLFLWLIILPLVLALVVSFRVSFRRKEKEIEFLETSSEEQDDIFDFLVERTSLAVAREELAMIRAERRSNSLFLIGSLLLVISVLCPIAAATLYWNVEPIPEKALHQLTQMKKELGELPAGLKLSLGRDWHILVSGLAFGFLCLASARGILNQQSRQAASFFQLNNRVNAFQRLKSALEIEFRHRGAEAEAEIVSLVVSRLLSGELDSDTPSSDGDDSDPVSDSPANLDLLLKLLKEVRS